MFQSLDQQKKQFRRHLVQKRAQSADSLAPSEAGKYAVKQFENLCETRLGIAKITLNSAGYWPICDEIDPRPIMVYLKSRGHRLALPRVSAEASPLHFHQWSDKIPLHAGLFGTYEPDAALPEVIPDILIIPLLGFDQKGTRLGYGGGYYDRSLQKIRTDPKFTKDYGPICIGLAYDDQYVDHLPSRETDYPLDLVVTPSKIYMFSDHALNNLQKAL